MEQPTAFLLSLLSAAAGCGSTTPNADPSSTDDTSTSGGSTSMNAPGSGHGETSPSQSSGVADESSGGATSDGAGSSAETDDDTPGPTDPAEICETWALALDACSDYSLDHNIDYCLSSISVDCYEESLAEFICMLEYPCEQWWEGGACSGEAEIHGTCIYACQDSGGTLVPTNDIEQRCAASVAKMVECGFDPAVQESQEQVCVSIANNNIMPSPACTAAHEAHTQCWAELECGVLECDQFVCTLTDPDACAAEYAAVRCACDYGYQ